MTLRSDGKLKLTALLLAVALLLTMLPHITGQGTALAVGNYGMITKKTVKVRTEPGGDSWIAQKLEKGFIVEITDTAKVNKVKWYAVKFDYTDEDGVTTKNCRGYVKEDCIRVLTTKEAKAWEANPVQTVGPSVSVTAAPTATAIPDDGSVVDLREVEGDDAGSSGKGSQETVTSAPKDAATATAAEKADKATATPTPAVTSAVLTGASGTINAGGVNFRGTEGGISLFKLDRGTVVELLSIPSVIDSNHWFKCKYNGTTGYVQAPYITVTSYGDLVTATPTGASDATATPATTASSPTGTYAKLILSSANLRSTPGGKKTNEWDDATLLLPITGAAVKNGGYTWYPVTYRKYPYYVRSDCIQVVKADGSVVTAEPVVTATPAVTATPTPAPTSATGTYARLILSSANLRSTPGGKKTNEWSDATQLLPITGKATVANGYTWYPVTYLGSAYYVRSDCIQVVYADGTAVTAEPTAVPVTTATADPASYGSIVLTVDKVNLRKTPAGVTLVQLPKQLEIPLTGNPVTSGKYVWYPVTVTVGKVTYSGYVRGDCARMSGSTATATPTPGDEATATPTVSTYGYVMITKSSTNLRSSAGGGTIGTVDKDTVWPMTGSSTTVGKYVWYPINVNGKTGYVRGDCSFKLSATQEASYLAGQGVPDEDNSGSQLSSYVITTVDKVNLRTSASKDANAPYNVATGTIMKYTTTRTVGGSLWYCVTYDSKSLWVLGSCVKIMTNDEYQEATGGSSATETPGDPGTVTGYVRTISSGINIRQSAGGTVILGRVNKNIVLPYYSEPVTVKKVTWYYVKTDYGYGYIHGSYVRVCQEDGSNTPVPTAAPTSTSGSQEATYTTLKLGSTGTAVKALVTALKEQGYYTGSITSTYTKAVQTAVKKFQKAKGLTVDGIAGSATQHALFGTVPSGSSDTSSLTMAIYPAEKIDWYTGGIQELWPKGANVKVYDVKTGIVWWAHRWSGGSHADVEPLTAADSARLCKIYGVSTTQQIADKNLYQRRPCLITIGTRTFACSLYGIPHNYPAGDTIANNDMKGQVCIHFTNSKTHTSNKVDSGHAAAIEYAWENAPNGHK